MSEHVLVLQGKTVKCVSSVTFKLEVARDKKMTCGRRTWSLVTFLWAAVSIDYDTLSLPLCRSKTSIG
jgi:hypothetical protein